MTTSSLSARANRGEQRTWPPHTEVDPAEPLFASFRGPNGNYGVCACGFILYDLDGAAVWARRVGLRYGEVMEALARALRRHGIEPDVLAGPQPLGGDATAADDNAYARLAGHNQN